MKFAKDLVTLANGVDYDIGRVMWALGVAAFLLFEGWDVIAHSKAFDMTAFGTGFAAIMVSGAGSLALKAKTEPQ